MAVYTELSFADIDDYVRLYDLASLQDAEGIRAGVENTNYCLTLKDGTKLILTLFEKRVDATDLPFFMELMETLALKDIPCPLPLHATDGSIIRQLSGKPATLITFLPGKSVASTSILPEHVSELGTYLARMHNATNYLFPSARKNSLSLSGWQQLAVQVVPQAGQLAHGLAEEITLELEALAARWPSDLPRGIIHADLFPDNVFFDANQRLSGLIDFYFACHDMLAYDLAICLNAWCFEPDYSFNITKARSLLRAYQAVRPLTPAEIDALPVLARGAAMRFLLTRTYDMLQPAKNALVTPKNPLEYRTKLRFHQRVADARQYGVQ